MRVLLVAVVFVAVVAAARAQATHTVKAGPGQSFTPEDIQVAPGDTVRWVNDGGIHNVRLDDDSYRSGNPTSDAELGSHTFAEAGTFRYYCEQHGLPNGIGMSGRVIVGDASATPTATPTATPEPGSIEDVVINRKVRRGRLRGSARVKPEGTPLRVDVRRSGKSVGRGVFDDTPERTAFAVKLSQSARKALADSGSLKVSVTLKAGSARAIRPVKLR